jgi:predicted nucleotidyltransferase
MDKKNILEYLSTHKAEFQKKYQVEKIGLFGSYARDEATEKSDIDIYVDIYPTIDNIMGLKRKIENSLNHKVDIITAHKNMRPFLLQTITKDICYV